MAHPTQSTLHLSRRATLLNTAQSFTQAFLAHLPPPQLLYKYFTPDSPRITEHGPTWATSRLPFLGHTFSGTDMCLQYFELLGQVLEVRLDEASFPGEEGFVVDEAAVAGAGEDDGVEEAVGPGGGGIEVDRGNQGNVGRGVVMVEGKGTFRSVKTGRSWEERFTYRLSGFDKQGRIGHWEIWADPLSAWVAVGDEEGGAVDQRMG